MNRNSLLLFVFLVKLRLIVQKERKVYSVSITYFLKALDCLKYLTDDAFVASFSSMCACEQKYRRKKV